MSLRLSRRRCGASFQRPLLTVRASPAGVPVATVSIGNGRNAGLLAVSILATSNEALQKKLLAYKKQMARESRAKNKNLAR